MAGGIPGPCAGCGDPTCGCCYADTADIVQSFGSGNPGDCFGFTIPAGRIAERVCAEAPLAGNLVAGDDVLVCDPTLGRRNYLGACGELNGLPPPVAGAAGDLAPGDNLVVVDGAGLCVRKRSVGAACPPAAVPALGPCLPADLEPVFCDPGTNTLRARPRSVTRTADLIVPDPAVFNLAGLAQGTAGVPATGAVLFTSGIANLTNPSCLYPMVVQLVAQPGTNLYFGPNNVWYQLIFEESVNAGAFSAIHSPFSDYRLAAGAGPFTDSRANPGWNRTFTIAAGAALTYQYRCTVIRLHPNAPNPAAFVRTLGGRVTLIGGSQ